MFRWKGSRIKANASIAEVREKFRVDGFQIHRLPGPEKRYLHFMYTVLICLKTAGWDSPCYFEILSEPPDISSRSKG